MEKIKTLYKKFIASRLLSLIAKLRKVKFTYKKIPSIKSTYFVGPTKSIKALYKKAPSIKSWDFMGLLGNIKSFFKKLPPIKSTYFVGLAKSIKAFYKKTPPIKPLGNIKSFFKKPSSLKSITLNDFIAQSKSLYENIILDKPSKLNRSQLSFLITFFSMSIIILLLFNMHLSGVKEEEYIVEMSLADEDIEELLKEEEKRLEELAKSKPVESHVAFNETAKPTVESPEPLKTLEELMEEKALENTSDEPSDADGEFAEQLKEMAAKREAQKQQISDLEEQKEEFTNNLKDKRTSISYSLIDRNAYALPPPIYTCIEGGKVVVNIKVDASGYVTEASFNDSSSDTTNGCLIDNAIAYAYKARFNPDSKTSQIGTITYLFQSK